MFHLREWQQETSTLPAEVGQQFLNNAQMSDFEKQPNEALSHFGGYQCPNCFKSYRMKGTLIRHIRFECGKDPQFQCPYCPQQTKHKSNMLRHIRRHHEPRP
jgi:uncharacterized Zn-finger protein